MRYIALILLLVSLNAHAERAVFLLMGQSNMSGRGDVSQAPSYQHIDDIYLLKADGTWESAPSEPLDDPAGSPYPVLDDSNAGAGVGLAFANRLIELNPGLEVGLVPAAKGATCIVKGECSPRWVSRWRPAALYGAALARAKSAMEWGSVKGILWHQGESDADGASGSAWSVSFHEIMRQFRTDTGNPNLPVVFARLGPDPGGKSTWNDIRAAQEDIIAPNLEMISSDGLSMQSDGIHFTTQGYVDLGIRFADAMDELL